MLSLDGTQSGLVASTYKKVTWLFEVTLSGSGSPDYYWSTKAVTFDAQPYTFKVLPESFSGIRLSRAKSEHGLQAPNSTSFSISNKATALDAEDFIDAKIHIKLVIGDGTDEEIIAQWVFIPSLPPKPLRQTIRFECVDYISRYLSGDYPNTPLVKDLFPSHDGNYEINDNMCVPLPFGTAYIPLRSVYTSSDRFYVLGPAANTYTITEVRSPRSMGANASTWDMTVYTDDQSNKTGRNGNSYKVFQAIIADDDGDGDADTNGLWRDGTAFADMPTQFTRNDTASMTSPADVIEYILEDFGIPSAMLNASSFATAKTTYSGWGLTFNFALFFKQDRREVLSNLLAMCHSTLVIEDTIKLKVLSKTSVATVSDTDVIGRNRDGTSFNYSYQKKTEYDSACIAYQVSGEPIDELVKVVVPVKAASTNISSDVLKLAAVHDSQDCQKLGTLNFQRKFGKIASVTFDGKGTLLAVQPDDVISFNDANYGGAYSVVVDEMRIARDLAIAFTSTRYEHALDDWGDLSPSIVTVYEDDSTAVWSPIIAGPDGFNLLPGKLRIGAGNPHIAIEPEVGITAYNSEGEPFFSVDIQGESVNIFSTLSDIDSDAADDLAQALSDAATAQGTADGKIVTFWQDGEPTAESIGDLWIDTNDNNNLYRWSGAAWVDIRDEGIAQALSDASGAQSTADGKIVTFYQDGEPTAEAVGDLWFDTDDDNKMYRWSGADWIAADDQRIADALAAAGDAQSTADGKIITFYQDSEPTADGVGDLWIDTDDDNKLHRWSGVAWVDVQDGEIAQALSDASDAQSTADGKIVTFYQATSPTAEGIGDLWFDTDDGNKCYRWSGAGWVEMPVDWDNLNGIPARFADVPSGAGLKHTDSYLGFYDGGDWKVYIQNHNGVGKFYVGDGSSQYIDYDGSSLTMSMPTVNIIAGGDLYMKGSAGGTAAIAFEDTSGTIIGYQTAAANTMGFHPYSSSSYALEIGTGGAFWNTIQLQAHSSIVLSIDTYDLIYNTSALYVDDHTVTLGTAADRFGTIYGGALNVTGNITVGGTVDGVDVAVLSSAVSGLGTMSTQNSNNVSITGGSIAGSTLSGAINISTSALTCGAISGTSFSGLVYGSGVYVSSLIRPTSSGGVACGNASYPWSYVHANTFVSYVGGYTGPDNLDDLKLIENIKPLKDKFDKHGIPIVDKHSFPEWCTTKEEIKEQFFSDPDATDADFEEAVHDDDEMGWMVGVKIDKVLGLYGGGIRQLKKEADARDKQFADAIKTLTDRIELLEAA